MGWLDKIFGSAKLDPVPIRTMAQFEELVLRSDIPVVIDVWSASCAPCRKLVPVFQDLATRYDGKVRIAEISTTAEMEVLRRLGVQATPTILIFDEGEEFGRVVGYHPRSWFDEMIAAEFPEVLGDTPAG